MHKCEQLKRKPLSKALFSKILAALFCRRHARRLPVTPASSSPSLSTFSTNLFHIFDKILFYHYSSHFIPARAFFLIKNVDAVDDISLACQAHTQFARIQLTRTRLFAKHRAAIISPLHSVRARAHTNKRALPFLLIHFRFSLFSISLIRKTTQGERRKMK